MNCNEAVAALVASLESGTNMTDEQRAHIQSCDRCRELLDSAKQFQTLLAGNGIHPPEAADTIAAAEEEVFRKRYWHALRVIAGVLLLFVVVTATGIVRLGDAEPREMLFMAGGVYVVSLLVFALMLFVFSLVSRKARGGKRRLYKRLGPGRMLSGVCLGISEAANIDVRLLRIIFVALLLADGVGFWIYLLLDLAMPVHPDDRQYLRRFRLRRWWARRTGHAEHRAG
ncbi:MAG TPA: PspC domain-containing protein [Thermoanaerobaculia bacterium]|jgi:phage shock protein PspC (stress-responsive transcriptional regulator)